MIPVSGDGCDPCEVLACDSCERRWQGRACDFCERLACDACERWACAMLAVTRSIGGV